LSSRERATIKSTSMVEFDPSRGIMVISFEVDEVNRCLEEGLKLTKP